MYIHIIYMYLFIDVRCSAAASQSSSWHRATTRAATRPESTSRMTLLNMEFKTRLQNSRCN